MTREGGEASKSAGGSKKIAVPQVDWTSDETPQRERYRGNWGPPYMTFAIVLDILLLFPLFSHSELIHNIKSRQPPSLYILFRDPSRVRKSYMEAPLDGIIIPDRRHAVMKTNLYLETQRPIERETMSKLNERAPEGGRPLFKRAVRKQEAQKLEIWLSRR